MKELEKVFIQAVAADFNVSEDELLTLCQQNVQRHLREHAAQLWQPRVCNATFAACSAPVF